MLSNYTRRLLITCLGMALAAGTSFAQSRPEGRGPGPLGFGGGGALELLQRPDVQTELELLDDQKSDARELAEQFNQRRREMFSGFAEQFRNRDSTEIDREALREQVRAAMEKLIEETDEGLSFLLPHQRQRLAQLATQFRMRGGNGIGALGSREISEQLGFTQEQREALRDRALELGSEFNKKLAELRREMQAKLLAELNPEQRAKFQELVGEPFEFQDRPPGGDRGRQPGGNR